MKKILRKIKHKLKSLSQWNPKFSKLDNILKIGTAYGGWAIPSNILSDKSICYLVGAGEDISFDVGLVEKYGCQVYIYDPTPRAKKHFDLLVENTKINKKTPINNSKTDFYNLKSNNLKLMHFRELGLWNKEDQLKFFSPKNPDHVSHSALNLQKTENYFTAKVNRLSEIMKQEGHKKIDLLKIDIEGAEYVVINSIIEDNLKIKIINVEYDEAYNPLDKYYQKRIKESVTKLIKYGYKIVDADLHYNFTFILDNE